MSLVVAMLNPAKDDKDSKVDPKDSPKLNTVEEIATANLILRSTNELVLHGQLEIWKLYLQRQSLRGNAPYEIGFLIRTSEERYRKMVDLYNTSITLDTMFRTREHILHLQAIEKLHWDLMHLANMLHEVERKYKIKPQVFEKRVFWPFGVKPSDTKKSTDDSKVTAEDTTVTTDHTLHDTTKNSTG